MGTEHEIMDILRELHALTKTQSRLLESSGLEGLDENLTAREQCLQKLNGIPDRAECAEGSAEIRALIAEIQAQEKQNAQWLQNSMSHLTEQMKKTSHGKTAMQGYDGLGSDLGSSFNAIQ